MEKAIGELHEPIPPGVSQASLQGATTKLRRAYAVLDQVILAALGGDRSWNTLVWWNALQDLLAPAALLVERRQEAYLPEPTNTPHPADVIQLQGENTKEWEARTSKAMGDAANLITASGRLREAVPFMGPPSCLLFLCHSLSLSLPLCCFLFLSLKRCKMLLHSWYAMLQKPPRSLLSMLLQCQEELSEEAGILSDEAYNVSSLMVCDVT